MLFRSEKDKVAFEIINKNAEKLQCNNIEIKKMDSLIYLENSKNIKFDFIYLDPPYKLDVLYQAMELIEKNKQLKEYGKIIIETNIDKQIEVPSGLTIQSERIYGKTKLVFVTKLI